MFERKHKLSRRVSVTNKRLKPTNSPDEVEINFILIGIGYAHGLNNFSSGTGMFPKFPSSEKLTSKEGLNP